MAYDSIARHGCEPLLSKSRNHARLQFGTASLLSYRLAGCLIRSDSGSANTRDWLDRLGTGCSAALEAGQNARLADEYTREEGFAAGVCEPAA